MKINKKGFTLVELLAVIAVLALLGAIAVPNIMSTIHNGKRSTFLSDAKRMVAKSEYLISINKSDREKVKNGTPVFYQFADLNNKGEFSKDPDNGSYNDNTYVKVTYASNAYNYCICVVGSKMRIGSGTNTTCNKSASDCILSTSLTGIDLVKDI